MLAVSCRNASPTQSSWQTALRPAQSSASSRPLAFHSASWRRRRHPVALNYDQVACDRTNGGWDASVCDCSYRALVRELHREEHPAVGRGLKVVVRDDVCARPSRCDARQQLALLLPLRRGACTCITLFGRF